MKLRIEFPAEDKIEETENPKVLQDADEGFYLVGEDFMVWVESTQWIVDQLLKFED